jgi:hypothetical protein
MLRWTLIRCGEVSYCKYTVAMFTELFKFLKINNLTKLVSIDKKIRIARNVLSRYILCSKLKKGGITAWISSWNYSAIYDNYTCQNVLQKTHVMREVSKRTLSKLGMVLIVETFPLVGLLTSLQLFVLHVYPCDCGLNMNNTEIFTLRVIVYEKY